MGNVGRAPWESEEFVRRVLDAVPGGVVQVDAEKIIVRANPEAARILTRTVDALVGQSVLHLGVEVIHQDGSPCPLVECPLGRALLYGEAQGPETLGFRQPEGHFLWAVFRAVPVPGEGGGLDGAIASFVDITEQKRIEERLRASERRWRLLGENVPDFLAIVDTDGRIVDVNASVPADSVHEVVGTLLFEHIDEDWLPAYRTRFEAAVTTGTTTRVETRLALARRGSWYDVFFVPFQDEGGVARVLVVARDVSEGKRVEEELRRSEAKWRLLAANIPDFVTLVDSDARFVSINRVLPELEEAALIGAQIYAFVAADHREVYRRIFERCVATREPARFETQAIGPKGNLVWYDTIIVPLGEIDQILVVARDINDRRTAEEAVRVSERRWRALVESLPDSVVVVDLDRRIVSANTRGSGYPEEQVLNVSCDDFVDETEVDAWRRSFAQAVASRRPVRYEGRARRAPGELSWYEAILVPLEEGGEVHRVMIVARDITERRAMLAGLAEKERLASIGMVAASVAHEIMNPLTYVLANLDFALGGRSPDEQRRTKALTEAREGAKRMQQIVWDLRSLGRTGGEELFYVDARAILDTALRLCGPEVGRSTRLVLELGDVPGVLASESRLCQVFINLLVNAAQAMDERLSEERELVVRAIHDEAAGLVGIAIRDTGAGIAKERLARIFEPFYTTKASGTGLGLSISRDMVVRMGGHITVESTLGSGTTFTVWLSTTRSASDRSAAASTSTASRP